MTLMTEKMAYNSFLIVSSKNIYEFSLKLPVNKVGKEKPRQALTVPKTPNRSFYLPSIPLDVFLSVFSPKVSPWMFRISDLERMMINKRAE